MLSPLFASWAFGDVFTDRPRIGLPRSLPSVPRQPGRRRPVRSRSTTSCGVRRGSTGVRPGAERSVRIPRTLRAGRFAACRRRAVETVAELSPSSRRDSPASLRYKCRPGLGPHVRSDVSRHRPQCNGEAWPPGPTHVARGRVCASVSSVALLDPRTASSVSSHPGVRWGFVKLVKAAVACWHVARGTRSVFVLEWDPRMGVSWPGITRPCVHALSEKCSLLPSDVSGARPWRAGPCTSATGSK